MAWYIASATRTNHVVQKSTETIIDIADLYNVLIRDMSTLNPEMDVDHLKVGEKIIIPGHPEAMYFAGVLSESGTENKPSDLFEAANGTTKEQKLDTHWHSSHMGEHWRKGLE